MTSNWRASSFPPLPPPPLPPPPVEEKPEPEPGLLLVLEKEFVDEPLLFEPVGVEAEWKPLYWFPPFEDEGPLLNEKEAVRVL